MSQPPEVQLAYLGFQLCSPQPALKPYVGSYWFFQRDSRLTTIHQEAMHPGGGFSLVFNLGDALELDGQQQQAPVFLDGANTISRRMGFFGHVQIAGIQFRTGGAYPFLDISLTELQNQTDALSALDYQSLLRLHAQLAEARTMMERIGLFDSWLLKRLASGTARSAIIPASLKRIDHSISQLREGYALPSISQLADDLGISQRQLEHLFRYQVGITPVQYVRLRRVEAARLALRQRKQSNTRLAVALGYYDQAHFIRDFRAVIGMTPYAYMIKKHS